MKTAILAAALAAITAPALAQYQGEITLELVPSATHANPGDTVSFSVLADFSGFTQWEFLLVALGSIQTTADAAILGGSIAPGSGLPYGEGTDEFGFSSYPYGDGFIAAAFTNGNLVAFSLRDNPQDVELFTFDVVAGTQSFDVLFGPANGVSFTTFPLNADPTQNHLVSGSVSISVPAPTGAALMLATLPLAARRRRA